jgi:hypothetical protein
MKLTPEQFARAVRLYWQWRGTVAPCGISHADAYNPCLPEEDERGLWCVTCGLRQRLALEAGR